tara:strand:+ start:390 stop:698 length:309 start_codon:yes stop_codon:yes gene_type:complete
MKKTLIIFFVTFLVLFTAFIKNSTKRIDDEIFLTEENIRILKKDYQNIKLEHDYLSSAEKLLRFQNLYFDSELIKKDIKDIKIIKKRSNKLEIQQLELTNNK